MEPYQDAEDQYRRFAEEATDSPCFSAWSRSVAGDPEVLRWIAGLPALKQQPNLVFAAARWHGVPAPGPYPALREALLADDGTIRATILARSTQTNEAGRLATLVPALATIQAAEDAPLSLLEVGASAGLCLYPDRWSYRWTGLSDTRVLGDGPELACEVEGDLTLLPTREVTVSRRSGIDLNPLDVGDDDAMAWLENLVWPEQDDRRARLRQAVGLARADPPKLSRADLLTELADHVEAAAQHGPVVVMHSAVIAYLTPADRSTFDATMRDLVANGACHWLSNEAPGVVPSMTTRDPSGRHGFVLGLDGRPFALTHGHGRRLRLLQSP